MNNINTKQYWDDRFSSGNWEEKRGRNQTEGFAKSQIKQLRIKKYFSGTILDFGCGLGDAFPIYKKAYPKAKFIGIDISEAAIAKCKTNFGDIANFISGTEKEVPSVDIIISSNVFEHLSNDIKIARELKQKCKVLYIIVPYKENLNASLCSEHVNSYDNNSFDKISSNIEIKIFRSEGWGESNKDLIFKVYFKNIGRFLLGRKLRRKVQQIMYKIQ